MHAPTPPPARKALVPVPRRVLLILLGIVALAAMAIPLWIISTTPDPVSPAVARLKQPRRVVPKAELPPVEPVELADVTRDDARSINAAIPFASGPNPAARPFVLTGSIEDRERAIACLAAAVLYEAGDDPVGQRAVAQVVLNRVRHPAFPNSVCGVVFQGSERRTGCQFTFTCDGALMRRYSTAAWDRARIAASDALSGAVFAKVGQSTHYHTDWVVPYWSSSLDKVAEVNTHLFLRWTGWWGTPPAFRSRYAGAEPHIAKLGALFPVHLGAGMMIGADGVIDPSAIPADAVPPPIVGDAGTFLLTLDKITNPAMFEAYALRTCGTRPYCKFMAWTDRKRTPTALPADSATIGAMSFSFLRDRARGFEKALWNCTEFPRANPAECMRRQLPAPAPAAELPRAVTTPVAVPTPAAGAATPVPTLSGVRRRPVPTPTPSPPAVRP